MEAVRICNNCHNFIRDGQKCPKCGINLNMFDKQLVARISSAENEFAQLLGATGALTPMAILRTNTSEDSIMFHIRGDGKEIEVKGLADMIRKQNNDLVSIVIATTINLPNFLYSMIGCKDGLCVFALSKEHAIKDIIPLVKNNGKLIFGNAIIRDDITNDFNTMGALRVLYEAFLGV